MTLSWSTLRWVKGWAASNFYFVASILGAGVKVTDALAVLVGGGCESPAHVCIAPHRCAARTYSVQRIRVVKVQIHLRGLCLHRSRKAQTVRC